MQKNKVAYLVHHIDDISWIRENVSNGHDLIFHEDYMSVLSDLSCKLFFDYPCDYINVDNEINYFLQYWHRNDDGEDVYSNNGISIGQILTAGLSFSITSMYREYSSLKYWLGRYEVIFISSNESDIFINIAKEFGKKIIIYESCNKGSLFLTSMVDRQLGHFPKVKLGSSILRLFQKPFFRFAKKKNLFLKDWTYKGRVEKDKNSLMVDSLFFWKGAYLKKPTEKDICEISALFPDKLIIPHSAQDFKRVLDKKRIKWDKQLLNIISNYLAARYEENRDYYIGVVSMYNELLTYYEPKNLVIPGEIFEPYNIVAQLARNNNIDVTFLVDGYPILTGIPFFLDKKGKALLCNRIIPLGEQNYVRFINYKLATKVLNPLYPPILDYHKNQKNDDKIYDVIILSYDNYLLMHPMQRLGATPTFVLDALNVCREYGLKNIAIKLKNKQEKRWMIPILQKNGWYDDVTLLDGMFYCHINKTKRVIGPISSAVGEAMFNDVPYYIFEPESDGYHKKRLQEAKVFNMDTIARNKKELKSILNIPTGSICVDKKYMFNGKYKIEL